MINTNIAWIEFKNPVFNASGPSCSTLDELEKIGESKSSWIIMKSCTLEEREGNPSPRYKEVPLGSINSMWLPNLWYKKYVEFSSILTKFWKPVIASIAWLKPDDFPIMVKEFQENSSVDLIEVNFSCPNVVWKPQIWYDAEAVDTILSKIDNLWTKPIWIKLPPYFDFVHYEQIAKIILNHNVAFITCINSVWNTLIIDPEKEEVLIKPKDWFGWLWWDFVKPVALANVRKFYELIWHKVQIIGCWWIKSWVDVFEFILAGASAVQTATQFEKEWTWSFERIVREFEDYINKKWYKSIDEFKGKLKSL
jgi:dihydroorotate dehydrogenase (fumarate)